jgi:hypothetical protein
MTTMLVLSIAVIHSLVANTSHSNVLMETNAPLIDVTRKKDVFTVLEFVMTKIHVLMTLVM